MIQILVDFQEEIIGENMLLIPKKENILDYSKCVFLEGSASEIWEYLKEGNDAISIKRKLKDKYNVEFEIISNDVERILEVLSMANIINRKEE